MPVEGDRVVGVVTARLGEGWKVDIGAADLAQLPALAFEGYRIWDGMGWDGWKD